VADLSAPPKPAKTPAAPVAPVVKGAGAAAPPEPGPGVGALRHDAAAIRRLFETGEFPYAQRLREAQYEEHMLALQRELLKAQRWIEERGEKIIVLFDARRLARRRNACHQGWQPRAY
jgi:hypothetical protein